MAKTLYGILADAMGDAPVLELTGGYTLTRRTYTDSDDRDGDAISCEAPSVPGGLFVADDDGEVTLY